jgi:hydrogenase expression/formation protein HypC
MCLGIPAKVVKVEKNIAEADVGGALRRISIELCPEVSVGDYVLIHTGFAIQRMDEEEAEETLKLLRQLAETL